MKLKRLKFVPCKMDMLSRINFMTFVVLFGLSCSDVFLNSPILKVEASLLELRKSQRDTDKLDSEHLRKHVQAEGDSTLETHSSNEDGRLTSPSFRVQPKEKIKAPVWEKEVEINTMGESTYNVNVSKENDIHFQQTYHEEENNESDEILLSVQNETDHFEWTDLGWTDVALVTLFCSIIAGTVAGNMLIIAAVVTTRRLRTVTNCFVMSLAVADWLVGMFVMPPKVFLYLVDNEWRFGRIFCELWISLDILLCTASILSLCAISIDRYLAITRPLAYSRRRRSKRLALSMISCVWIAAVVITSPPIFGWYEEDRNTDNKCEYNENTGYVVYSALGSFFLPLLVMLYVYARIACVIMRRQRSIQKLHARTDRRSQYCGSDAEEPLHQKDRDDDGANGENGERLSNKTVSRLTVEGGNVAENQELAHSVTIAVPSPREVGERLSVDTIPRSGNQEAGLLGRFRFKSCTSANDEDYEDTKYNRTKSGENGNSNSGGRGMNRTTTLAISLPDPATLASGSGTENSSGSNTDHESCYNSSNLQMTQQEQLRPGSSRYTVHGQQQQYVSRMKTGSRLCHHSIATASPQRNIHRVHQTSQSGRSFEGDHEPHLKSTGSCNSLDKSPRVWTVERTLSPTEMEKEAEELKISTGNCRSCSYEHELVESGSLIVDKSTSQMESVLIMDCSPAGNPASLMSAASASGSTSNPMSPSPHDKRNSYSNRSQNRINQPQNTQNSHHRTIPSNQFASTTGTVGMQRIRSMKFLSNVQSNDQNHNGGTSSRDFSSGRIASFKRETKTAQTLAAVVGGFIICWLPFFLAYIMGPFTPSSDTISTALMDALIWLGWSNSAINPFIYAFYSDQFRSAFWRLTVHKCEGVLRNRNQSRNSPRRYEDPPQQQRVST